MVARGEGRSCIVIKSVNGRNRGVVNVTYRPSLQEAFPRRNSRKPYLKQKGTVTFYVEHTEIGLLQLKTTN